MFFNATDRSHASRNVWEILKYLDSNTNIIFKAEVVF